MKQEEIDEENCITIPENADPIEEEVVKAEKIKAKKMAEFDLAFADSLKDLSGTKEEREEVLRRRLVRFFSYGEKLNVEGGYFQKRRQPDYSNPATSTLDNEIILFGIDLLSIKKLKSNYIVSNIVRIDDSHAKLIYQDAADAFSILKTHAKDPKLFQIKTEDEIELPKGWIELKPYYELNIERKLFARYATSCEKIIEPEEQFINVLYRRAKQIFQRGEREHFQSFQAQRQRERPGRARPNFNQERQRSRSRQNLPKKKNNRSQASDLSFRQGQGQAAEKTQQKLKDLSFNFDKEPSENNSNLSFMLNKSKGEFSEINHAIDDIRLSDNSSNFAQNVLHQKQNPQDNNMSMQANSINGQKSSQQKQKICSQGNLSFELNRSRSVRQQMDQSFANHGDVPTMTKFNYKQYVEDTEKRERQIRIPVISLLDDD